MSTTNDTPDLDVGGPFLLLAELCTVRGEVSLKDRVPLGQCHPVPIDATWSAWINPHVESAFFEVEDGMSGEVPPFSAWINYNGWLWGLVDPFGGRVGNHPDPNGGNLDRFTRDVEAAIAKAEGGAS